MGTPETKHSMGTTAADQLLGEFPPNTYEEWRKAAEELLQGAPFEKKMFSKTPEGITLSPIYNAADTAGLSKGTLPGGDTYLRGATAEGYIAEPWAIAQELPYGTPEEFNRALLEDLMRGQTCVNVLLDIASVSGRDPDSSRVGEVGACGVSLACIEDVDRAFQGVHPQAVSFYFQAGASALPVAALFMAWLSRHGADPREVRGALNADPLAVLASSGSLPVTLPRALDEMDALVRHLSVQSPSLSAIGVSSLPYAHSGANALQELAMTLATGVAYVRGMLERGLDIDTICRQMFFTLSIGADFFTEIAKLRAARHLWAKVAEAFGASPEARSMKIHGRTSLWNKTVTDPWVNLLRTSTEALSAAVGGVQSLHTGAFDECIRVPDSFSRRIARNTQVILQEECELTSVIDPAGGSWFIEKLTDELASGAWKLFQEIEKQGGALSVLESGWIQEKITAVRNERLKQVAQRRQTLIGTNLFPDPDEKPLDRRIPDYREIHARRSRQLAEFRTGNDSERDVEIMEQLGKIASTAHRVELMPLIAAAFSGATIGEISSALRSGFEGGPRVRHLPCIRAGQAFEHLRAASLGYKAAKGHAPQIYLTNIGPLKRHKARMDFTIGFFQTGGFELLAGEGTEDAVKAAHACRNSGARITVICGTDDAYPAFVPAFCEALKALDSRIKVVLAGQPGDNEAAFRAAGLDDFIFVKSENYAVNHQYLKELGVIA